MSSPLFYSSLLSPKPLDSTAVWRRLVGDTKVDPTRLRMNHELAFPKHRSAAAIAATTETMHWCCYCWYACPFAVIFLSLKFNVWKLRMGNYCTPNRVIKVLFPSSWIEWAKRTSELKNILQRHAEDSETWNEIVDHSMYLIVVRLNRVAFCHNEILH